MTSTAEHRRRPPLPVLLGAAACLYVLGTAGSIIAPTLVRTRPALVLAMSSRNRHLLLTSAAGINPVAFFAIAFVRLSIISLVFFLLGEGWGRKGMKWLEKEAGTLPFGFRFAEKAIRRAGWAIVMLLPGSTLVGPLAGMEGMKRRTFAFFTGIGIVCRLLFFWFLGKAFQDPLQDVLTFIQKYQWPITGGLLALSIISSMRQASRRLPPIDPETGELDVEEVDAELAEIDETQN